MARFLSKTLIPQTRFILGRSVDFLPAQPSGLCFRRYCSSKADLDQSSSASSSSAGSSSSLSEEPAIIKKLDDIVRTIIVHKATPIWLPFIPGASFWVPPPRNTAATIANLVDKATNELTEEESLSIMSPYGWPCSFYFIPQDDTEATQGQEIGLEFEVSGNDVLEVKLELLPDSDDSSKPGDEEK